MNIEQLLKQGLSHCESGNYKEGILLFSKGLKTDPDNLSLLFNRAKAYYREDMPEKALADMHKAVQLNPANASLYCERGILLHVTGQNELAMQDFNKAVELEPQNPFRYSSRAYIKDRMGDYEGALEDYSKTIALDPEDAIAYNNKGLVEEKMGRKQQSVQSFAFADKLDKNGGLKKVESQADGRDIKNPERGNTQPQVPARPPQQEKISTKGYFSTLKKVLTEKETFSEFKNFVAKNFNLKK